MTFTYNILESTYPEWEMKTQQNAAGKAIPEWVLSGKNITTNYVVDARIQDDDYCDQPKYIRLYSTADGPILGIEHETYADAIRLLDPCAVLFDGKSSLNLLPIFNVGRFMYLSRSAIRVEQAPAEILLAAYPGFLIQNRMSKYQLKATTPFVTTPELTNDGV
jgi:hypothetical protein